MEINKVASNDTRSRDDAQDDASHALDIARWDDEGGAARPRATDNETRSKTRVDREQPTARNAPLVSSEAFCSSRQSHHEIIAGDR